MSVTTIIPKILKIEFIGGGSWELNKHLNLFVGPNGIGKTKILEMIKSTGE